MGLKVIACVGETLVEREAGKTTEVVFSQLQAIAGTYLSVAEEEEANDDVHAFRQCEGLGECCYW